MIINLEEKIAISHMNCNIKKIYEYWVTAKVHKNLLLEGLFRSKETRGSFILPYFSHVLIANVTI